MERRIVGPQRDVEQFFPHLRFRLEREAATREDTLVEKKVVNGHGSGISKDEICDFSGNVPHVSAAKRTIAAAKEAWPGLLRLQKQSGCFKATAGENNSVRFDARFPFRILDRQGCDGAAILRQMHLSDGGSEQHADAR